MTTKILITGANGQLGNELRTLAAVHPDWEFVYTDTPDLDITNVEQTLHRVMQIEPNFIINCAAYTAVDKAESETQTAISVNTTAVHNLAAAAQLVKAYLIHISTDYVFDGKNYMPYREDDPTCPQTTYGLTKRDGEGHALAAGKSVVIRTAWLYSAFGNNFVKTMLRLGRQQPSVNVVNDQIGTPTYAADLAAVILHIVDAALRDESKFVRGIFHFSNEGVCSWYDFAVAIMRLAELPCKVLPVGTSAYPTPAQRPHYSVLCKERIKECYGIAGRHWQDALAECLQKI
jgi:dTDP-4-dehydrorhamnose reductase